MYIIGVTGPSGAGKSVVSQYLRKFHGYKLINADKVYHRIISGPSDCVNELVEHFGKEILNEEGGIDRKALAALVFGEENKDKLELLNKITHKYVIAKINKRVEKFTEEGEKFCVIDAPLLIEAGINEMCDLVYAVVAYKENRAERIAERDGIDFKDALLRIESQKPDKFYSDNCDVLLRNNLGFRELFYVVDMSLRYRGLIK